MCVIIHMYPYLPACSPLESLSSSDDEEIQRVTNSSPPKVVLNSEEVENHHEAHVDSLPPVLRRARLKKASSSSPSISPKVASPEVSPFTSPRTTPRGSPVNSPRGVRKFIKRGKVSLCQPLTCTLGVAFLYLVYQHNEVCYLWWNVL